MKDRLNLRISDGGLVIRVIDGTVKRAFLYSEYHTLTNVLIVSAAPNNIYGTLTQDYLDGEIGKEGWKKVAKFCMAEIDDGTAELEVVFDMTDYTSGEGQTLLKKLMFGRLGASRRQITGGMCSDGFVAQICSKLCVFPYSPINFVKAHPKLVKAHVRGLFEESADYAEFKEAYRKMLENVFHNFEEHVWNMTLKRATEVARGLVAEQKTGIPAARRC